MRTKFKFNVEGKPDFILCADLHIRETTPACRQSSFLEEMIQKLKWMKELSDNHLKIPVLCAGDVFDTWKCKDWWLFNLAHKYLPEKFICIAGQHDLPRHSLELPERSPLSILHEMGRIEFLGPYDSYFDPQSLTWIEGRSYGARRPSVHTGTSSRKLLLTHEMVWLEKPYPEAPKEGRAPQIFKRYPNFDIIVSGDNHIPFTVKKGKQLLINCGSMLRTSIIQAKHKPCIWLYYVKSNEVKPLYFPTQDTFHEYEIVEDNRDERIAAVVKRLSEGMTMDISFEENIKRYITKDKPPRRVREILIEILGE